MQPERKSRWVQRCTFVLVFLSMLSCTIFGYDLTGGASQPVQTVEVTRIVQETVIVPGPETIITSAPVVVEITREVEVTRRVEVPVTRVVTSVPLSPPMNLAGVWLNPSTNSVTVIIWDRDRFRAVAVIDLDDGEVYPVTASNWDGSIIQWAYYVPSTTYNVTFTMTSLVGDDLNCNWSNDHGASGVRTLTRQ